MASASPPTPSRTTRAAKLEIPLRATAPEPLRLYVLLCGFAICHLAAWPLCFRMAIRPLTPADASLYISLRREMLADSPWAFASSPEDDSALDPAVIVSRVSDPGQAIFGAFDDAPTPCLLGTAGLYRLTRVKTAHRAYIRGVYVTPSARSRGLATALLTAALELARTWPGVTSVGLSVSERSAEAQRLYERVGFKPWGREPAAITTGGRTYDEIHMLAFLKSLGERLLQTSQPANSPTLAAPVQHPAR